MTKTFDDHLREREAQNCYRSTRLWTPRPHLLGMIGERALARYFGARQDLRNKPYGDKGIDLEICLRASSLGPEWFRLDAKCSSYGDYLRVDRKIIKRRTIYVLVYSKTEECVGWQWGRDLMRVRPINWCGNGVFVHAMHVSKLRDMSELKSRFVSWRHARSEQ